MNGGPLHPLVVHLPLGIAVILPLVAVAITLALWRGWLTPRSWAIVVLLQVLMVGAGFAALQTGEADEERVEAVVAEQYIEAHEEAAYAFMVGAGISLALGAAGLLLLKRPRALRLAALGTTLATVVVAGLAVGTGRPGGQLVYEHGAAQAYVKGGKAAPTAEVDRGGQGRGEGGGYQYGEGDDD